MDLAVRMHNRIKVVLVLVACLLPLSSWAVCGSDPEGTLRYISGNLRICNGSSWLFTTDVVTGSACSGAGTIQYLSSYIRYCNGSNWVRVGSTVNEGACGSAGYFYYAPATNLYWFCNGANWHRMN